MHTFSLFYWVHRHLACMALFLLFFSVSASAQITRYVSTTGTNSNPASATTWAASTTDLQGAINASSANDQVWVAGGIYKPGGNQNTNRSISFSMKNGVAIYGGFRGTETDLLQRFPITLSSPSSSTLSGDLGTLNNTTDNSYHVFNNPNTLTNSAILDGFIVTGGNANAADPDYNNQEGGGMRNNGYLGRCNPTIRYCLFTANFARIGAAIYNGGQFGTTGSGSSPVLINCWWVNNTANQYGGGMYNNGSSGNSSPRLINCLFFNNSTQNGSGSGLHNVGYGGVSNPELINCTLTGNSGSAFHNDGRNSGICAPRIINCIIWPNTMTGESATPIINYSDVAGGVPAGTGNISADPQFVDATSGNLQLRPLSPAIDAGNSLSYTAANGPNTDLGGNTRIVGQQIDMGVLEYNSPCSVSLTSSTQTRCTSTTITLTAIPLGGLRPFSYSWTASAGITLPTSTSTNTVTVVGVGAQSVTVTMADALGCSTQTTLSFTLTDTSRLYVKAGGTGDGSSWDAASGDLQAMINQACPNGQVWVATGLYTPTSGTSRTVSFAMRNQVSIYGGFQGTESMLSQRRPITLSSPSSSTLSGNIGDPASASDNSYHVFNNPNTLTNSAILDGFVITGGNANAADTDYNNQEGGGMRNNGYLGQCNPTIRYCLFTANSAKNGAAIYNGGQFGTTGSGSSPVLINCWLVSNSASQYGGGMYSYGYSGNSSPRLINCLIRNNSAQYGGGLYNDGSTLSGSSVLEFINCTFTGNTGVGAAMYNDGSYGTFSPRITNCIIWPNTISGNNATPIINYSDVAGGVPAGTGNISADPQFVDASSGNVQVRPLSPVINAGNSLSYTAANGPATDLNGNNRIVGQQIDMGALEYNTPCSVSLSSSNQQVRCVGSITSLTALPTGGMRPFSYSWTSSGGVTLGTPTSTSTLAVTLTGSGIQSVTVTMTDAISCVSQATLSFSLVENTPVFVKAGASGSGSSWADASGDLQAMINQACPNGQVWVATGLYKPTTGSDRTISFTMRNQIAIYGGFDGDEETLQERPTVSITSPSRSTLSGDIGTANVVTDNSYHVIFNTGLNSSAVLDGFVIVSGNANGSTDSRKSGGGMYNNGESGQCSPAIRNCIFRNNLAINYGGGMYNNGYSGNSSPTIIGCAFLANSCGSITSTNSTIGGGGLYNDGYSGTSRPVITNCLFSQNTATNGGAIYNDGTLGTSSMTLVNCTIHGNTARVAGAINSVRTATGTSNHVLVNSIIWGNTATNNSPGLRTSTGANHTVAFSDVQNFTPVTGSGNLSVDPVFSNTATGNFTLQNTSPVIDKGNSTSYTAFNGPPTDGAGNPRIVNQQIDMGAFESAVTSPTVVASSSVSAVCPGGVISLSALVSGGVSPFSYTWTAPDGTTLYPSSTSITSATLATTGVKTFTVTALDSRSQLTTATISSTVNALPIISSFVTSGTLTCSNPSVTLTATMSDSSPYSYSFSSGAASIGSGNQATVTIAGTYTLLATNTLTGCSSTTSVTVEQDVTAVPVSLSASSTTLTCSVESVTLTATASGNSTYTFSAGNPTSNPNQVVVASPGIYSVIVTGQNGCTNVASTTISQNTSAPETPVLSVSNNGTLTCANASLTLLASVTDATNLTFSFAGPGLTTQPSLANSVSIGQPGTYTVTVINARGCTSFTTLSVADNTAPPIVSLSASNGGQLTCSNPSLVLTASSNIASTFVFTGPGIISQNAGGVASVTAIGIYSVTARSDNGCTASTTLNVSGSTDLVGPVSVQTIGALGCLSSSVTLVATASGANSYSLSGPSGSQSANAGVFVVGEAGSYTILAGNGVAGCMSTAVKQISQSPPASASNFRAGGTISCGKPTQLTANGTGSSFIFTGPEGYIFSNVYRTPGTYTVFANDVNVPGQYTLTVHSGEGCPPAVYTIEVMGARCP